MKKIGILVLAALLFSTAGAQASTAKIAVVDLRKALNVCAEGKAAKGEITTRMKELETQVAQRQADLKKLQEELEKQAVLLSAEARANKERDFQQKLKDLQRFGKDSQEELQQKDAEASNRIVEKLVGLVREIGKQEKFDLVLEQNGGGVIYSGESVDLTERVIKEFDARFQAPKTK